MYTIHNYIYEKVEESIEKLLVQIHELQIELDKEINKNKTITQNFYEIITELNKNQEAFLSSINKHKITSNKNKVLLKEMDIIQSNKKYLEKICDEQNVEIKRAIILIGKYLKK